MRKKLVSKRRWRKRLLKGLWIPGTVIWTFGWLAPPGWELVPHPKEPDFWMLVKKAPDREP
jgi:hypothetical protein